MLSIAIHKTCCKNANIFFLFSPSKNLLIFHTQKKKNNVQIKICKINNKSEKNDHTNEGNKKLYSQHFN